ncbi:MAG: pantoate--beta-alanine ligase [Vulcanimicrobiaceae bacterium]
MQVVDAILPARAVLGAAARPLGFVPTMGALHEGHLGLVRAARRSCRTVAVSLFVNPTQFGPGEDYDRYPRDVEGDRRKMEEAGVDVLFAPGREAMYPPGFSTWVDVGEIGARYEGAVRPGHFRGVSTIVLKLLNVIAPDALFLGQKDAQQTSVLRRMIRDLDLDVRVEIVPTVREADGLALSSRNVFLSQEQRQAAPTLQRALGELRDALERGDGKEAALGAARGVLDRQATLDYLDVVDADTFEPLDALRAPAFVIGAGRFGRTRLLDNIWLPA